MSPIIITPIIYDEMLHFFVVFAAYYTALIHPIGNAFKRPTFRPKVFYAVESAF